MTSLDVIFFDLDDTLYRQGNGVWQAISARIDRFLMDRLELEQAAAQQLRQSYYRRYGTTLTGLMTDFQMPPDEYLEYVHDIDVDELLAPEPEIAALLGQLPQRKLVFTNASRAHAARVLAALDLAPYFDRVIAIEDLNYRNKPDLVAYTTALQLAEHTDASQSMLIDDRLENLRPAQSLGMQVRWIHPSEEPIEAAEIHHRSLVDCLQTLIGRVAESQP